MRLVEVGVCVLMIATILSDLVNVGLYEQWFIAVLLMDVLLLTNPDPRLAWTLYGMTMSWIVLRTAEDASRFGMYEHIPYNEDNQPRPAEGWSWGFPILVLRCGVFGLDHALTRRFAVGMKKERERLDTSVIMAEEVADALIRFDLIRAESLISSQDVAIKDSFIRLLENLKMYRPYLPPTIFCGGDEDAYLRKEDSNSYFVPIPGAVMPNQDPTSPASLTQTQTEIELEEITVTDAKLRENLEVGVRVRKGSVLRTAFDTISLEVQDTFALVAPFAEVCLQEVKNWGGVVLHLNGSVLLAGWNTHLPCPRHSLHAVRCSLILGNSLTSSPTAFPHHCCVTACGRLAVGSTGTEFIRSPFVLGNPVVQVEAMSILCRPLDCTQIITEGVYEATRTQVNGRLIDVIPEIPCPYAGNLDSIGLYELCDFFPFERTQYMNAFIAFSVNKPESVDLFQEYLKECPGDVQAARILKLALAARDRPEFLPIPYVRSMVGWKMLEQEAEGILPEDVKALFSFKREVKRVPELPPPMLEQDQLLKALHAAASKRNSMHDNFEFVDLEGSRWYRSGKSLGSGSFGEVWLGMGEDGGLVAMKWLAVSGPKDFDTITNLSKCSGESSKKSPSVRSMTSFTDQRLKERLEEVKKEVELLSKLKHENIVCYLSVAAVQTSIVINMEYVPGGSLQNLLEQFGILPLSSVQRYVKDILKGFRYLHKTNVAHRDFKPGNVLVQIDGQCKLSDFGASAALSDVMGRNVVGTLLYMSPEACRGEADTSSDIWSLGITTAQMLSGELPYNVSEIEPHTFLYHLSKEREDFLPVIPDLIDEDAKEFIKSCVLLNNRPAADELLYHKFIVG
eukprot:TRINITY_DN969_c2_g1_i1.p1 TRINITY_DN969_c2_g1~~TRINITY_DN969_c2_g1_i1.p1  ORF type:complete len:965 (+),score=125.55 TRINITY_DN969_c2_g1_i1:347-2896(+)